MSNTKDSCSFNQTTDKDQQWIDIETPYSHFKMTLFGAHITQFINKADGKDRLFVSKNARLDGSKSIRGGIPICWPWFGDHTDPDMPAHGYVRTLQWTLTKHTINTDSSVTLWLSPESSKELTTAKGYNPELAVELVITVGEQLVVELITTNNGTKAQVYTAALHSYFAVNDIKQTELMGLYGEYKDKCQGFTLHDTPMPYTFSAETDRVHLCTTEKIMIEESDADTFVYSSGHDSIVVWNPWQEKSESMADMEDTSYQHMVCVETAVTQGHTLAPGESHHLTQIIK